MPKNPLFKTDFLQNANPFLQIATPTFDCVCFDELRALLHHHAPVSLTKILSKPKAARLVEVSTALRRDINAKLVSEITRVRSCFCGDQDLKNPDPTGKTKTYKPDSQIATPYLIRTDAFYVSDKFNSQQRNIIIKFIRSMPVQ